MLSEHKLYLFISELSEYYLILSRLEKRGFQNDLIELLIKQGVENKEFLQNQEKMSKLRTMLIEKKYDVSELSWNDERNIYELTVTPPFNGDKRQFFTELTGKDAAPVKIGRSLVYSNDFQKSIVLGKNIFKYDTPPFLIFDKDKKADSVCIQDKQSLLTIMITEGKKGIGIQRYKGLGEMNPDQLWETTMNPEKRTLLQVKVDDMVESDEIFTILMGEQVEPRREFINNNALEVSVLDI
jgi:DNA gyrase subunit B